MRFLSPSLALGFGILALNSSVALAVVDVQVLAGRTSATDATPSASVMVGSAHLAPMPLVPLAIGATASSASAAVSDATYGKGSATATTIGPELMVWLPGLPLSPYAKASNAVYRKSIVDYGGTVIETTATSVKADGARLGGGLQWSPIPVVSLLGEYRQSLGAVAEKTFLIGLAAGL